MRVMATCAVLGEAAGIGAALTQKIEVTPTALAMTMSPSCAARWCGPDASVLGIEHDRIRLDLALRADVRASSTKTTLASTQSAGQVTLVDDLGLVLPVDPLLDGIDVLVD